MTEVHEHISKPMNLANSAVLRALAEEEYEQQCVFSNKRQSRSRYRQSSPSQQQQQQHGHHHSIIIDRDTVLKINRLATRRSLHRRDHSWPPPESPEVSARSRSRSSSNDTVRFDDSVCKRNEIAHIRAKFNENGNKNKELTKTNRSSENFGKSRKNNSTAAASRNDTMKKTKVTALRKRIDWTQLAHQHSSDDLNVSCGSKIFYSPELQRVADEDIGLVEPKRQYYEQLSSSVLSSEAPKRWRSYENFNDPSADVCKTTTTTAAATLALITKGAARNIMINRQSYSLDRGQARQRRRQQLPPLKPRGSSIGIVVVGPAQGGNNPKSNTEKVVTLPTAVEATHSEGLQATTTTNTSTLRTSTSPPKTSPLMQQRRAIKFATEITIQYDTNDNSKEAKLFTSSSQTNNDSVGNKSSRKQSSIIHLHPLSLTKCNNDKIDFDDIPLPPTPFSSSTKLCPSIAATNNNSSDGTEPQLVNKLLPPDLITTTVPTTTAIACPYKLSTEKQQTGCEPKTTMTQPSLSKSGDERPKTNFVPISVEQTSNTATKPLEASIKAVDSEENIVYDDTCIYLRSIDLQDNTVAYIPAAITFLAQLPDETISSRQQKKEEIRVSAPETGNQTKLDSAAPQPTPPPPPPPPPLTTMIQPPIYKFFKSNENLHPSHSFSLDLQNHRLVKRTKQENRLEANEQQSTFITRLPITPDGIRLAREGQVYRTTSSESPATRFGEANNLPPESELTTFTQRNNFVSSPAPQSSLLSSSPSNNNEEKSNNTRNSVTEKKEGSSHHRRSGIYYTDGEYLYGPFEDSGNNGEQKLQPGPIRIQPITTVENESHVMPSLPTQIEIKPLEEKYGQIQKSITEHLRQIDRCMMTARKALNHSLAEMKEPQAVPKDKQQQEEMQPLELSSSSPAAMIIEAPLQAMIRNIFRKSHSPNVTLETMMIENSDDNVKSSCSCAVAVVENVPIVEQALSDLSNVSLMLLKTDDCVKQSTPMVVTSCKMVIAPPLSQPVVTNEKPPTNHDDDGKQKETTSSNNENVDNANLSSMMMETDSIESTVTITKNQFPIDYNHVANHADDAQVSDFNDGRETHMTKKQTEQVKRVGNAGIIAGNLSSTDDDDQNILPAPPLNCDEDNFKRSFNDRPKNMTVYCGSPGLYQEIIKAESEDWLTDDTDFSAPINRRTSEINIKDIDSVATTTTLLSQQSSAVDATNVEILVQSSNPETSLATDNIDRHVQFSESTKSAPAPAAEIDNETKAIALQCSEDLPSPSPSLRPQSVNSQLKYVPQVEGHNVGLLVRTNITPGYHHERRSISPITMAPIVVGDTNDDRPVRGRNRKTGMTTTTDDNKSSSEKVRSLSQPPPFEYMVEYYDPPGCATTSTIDLPSVCHPLLDISCSSSYSSLINRSFDNLLPRPYTPVCEGEYTGYKRVAWPPIVEDKIPREFTPPFQTQFEPQQNNQQPHLTPAAGVLPNQNQIYRTSSAPIDYQQPQPKPQGSGGYYQIQQQQNQYQQPNQLLYQDNHQQLKHPPENQYKNYHSQPREQTPQQQQNLHRQQRGESPGIITLRKEVPITQQPSLVYSSQPATASYRGGSNMRGDLKWPPPEYKEQAALENEDRLKLAKGPVCRPRRVKKDYTHFFAKNALNSYYPSYRVPPGTQHMIN